VGEKMTEIIASNSDRFPVGTGCGIRTGMGGLGTKPSTFFAMVKTFKHENVEFKSIAVEILDEEKSKSFLGSAGFGLVGAALLGPLGLIAGVFAGGNKKTGVFALKFKLDGQEIKLVVKSSDKRMIGFFKENSFASNVS